MIKLVKQPNNKIPEVFIENRPPLKPGMVFVIKYTNSVYMLLEDDGNLRNKVLDLKNYGVTFNGTGNDGWGCWSNYQLDGCLVFDNLEEYYRWKLNG